MPQNDEWTKPTEETRLLCHQRQQQQDKMGGAHAGRCNGTKAAAAASFCILLLFVERMRTSSSNIMEEQTPKLSFVSTGEESFVHDSFPSPNTPVVASQLNPNLSATVLECFDLLYTTTDTDSLLLDRPNHLRAGSSLQWITPSRLAVLQDDVNFIGLIDVDLQLDNTNDKIPSLTIVHAYSITLPASRGGIRQFHRHNKENKLDLEASIYIPPQHSPFKDEGFLLAFGSGSGPHRNVIILIRDSLLLAKENVNNENFQPVNITYWSDYCGNNISATPIPSPLVAFYAPAFYQDTLRQNINFAGSELNIEGAAYIASQDKIRFFQRGNGKARGNISPKSSTGEVFAEELFRHLDSLLVQDGQAPLFYPATIEPNKHMLPPRLDSIVNFDLGTVQGVPLTFTGSTPAVAILDNDGDDDDHEVEFVYTAGAEASPDATRDGAVVGTALGLVTSQDFPNRDAGSYNFMTYPNGTVFLHKTEGVTIPPQYGFWRNENGVALTVLDLDDPNVPSQMCLVHMTLLSRRNN